jgi:hypothetical protein
MHVRIVKSKTESPFQDEYIIKCTDRVALLLETLQLRDRSHRLCCMAVYPCESVLDCETV